MLNIAITITTGFQHAVRICFTLKCSHVNLGLLFVHSWSKYFKSSVFFELHRTNLFAHVITQCTQCKSNNRQLLYCTYFMGSFYHIQHFYNKLNNCVYQIQSAILYNVNAKKGVDANLLLMTWGADELKISAWAKRICTEPEPLWFQFINLGRQERHNTRESNLGWALNTAHAAGVYKSDCFFMGK